MNIKEDLVTIALHVGYSPNYPLIENFLKSFLICNKYPNIELMLIETGENEDLREWFTKIDFDSEFVNYDGTKTTIKKHSNVNITKRTLFIDKLDGEWYHNANHAPTFPGMAYTNAIKTAAKESKGKYFAFLVEDYQFNLVGNTIGEHINAIKELGELKTMLMFFTTTELYKYGQPTNRPPAGFRLEKLENSNFGVFKAAEPKFDFYTFFEKSIFNELGDMPMPTKEERDLYRKECTKHIESTGWSRYYPMVFGGLQFPNRLHEWATKEIIEGTKANPDYVLFKVFDRDFAYLSTLKEYKKIGQNNIRPMTTEDFYIHVNGATNNKIYYTAP
jgi:hypothetical protein